MANRIPELSEKLFVQMTLQIVEQWPKRKRICAKSIPAITIVYINIQTNVTHLIPWKKNICGKIIEAVHQSKEYCETTCY